MTRLTCEFRLPEADPDELTRFVIDGQAPALVSRLLLQRRDDGPAILLDDLTHLTGGVRTQTWVWPGACLSGRLATKSAGRGCSLPCPHCASATTARQPKTTTLGYQTFRCAAGRRSFNERTGTAFNFLESPTDIVLLVVLWRLRYKLSLRDLAEMFFERGFVFTHEAVREWEERFAPLFAERLRAKRRGKAGRSWSVDETYIKVRGRWCYLYRAVDRDGNLVDSLLSESRDLVTARRFFRRARAVVGHAPDRVTTDGHEAYPAPSAGRWGGRSSTAATGT